MLSPTYIRYIITEKTSIPVCYGSNRQRPLLNCCPFFTGPVLKSKEWVHITGSHRVSTGRARLYINGKLIKEVNSTKPTKQSAPTGMAADLPSWQCAGLGARDQPQAPEAVIDEFYVFKCELLKDEIQDLYTKNSVKRFRIPRPHLQFSTQWVFKLAFAFCVAEDISTWHCRVVKLPAQMSRFAPFWYWKEWARAYNN